LYSIWVVVNRLFLSLPIAIALLVTFLPDYLGTDHLQLGNPTFYRDALIISIVLFYGGLLLGFAAVVSIPRLLHLLVKPGKVYPLYGLHYGLQRMIGRMTNIRLFMNITGDSSLVIHYLRALGYKQPGLIQTGSNFGIELTHDNPYLTTIGSGTMVSDGLGISNVDFSSTSLRTSPTVIGGKNFFGNDVGYPVGGRTGENCLFGTKTMVPIDGPLRENIGLLGSPPFEIPRSVERDSAFDDLKAEEELRLRMPAKNRHNAVTLIIYLNVTVFRLFIGVVMDAVAAEYFRVFGAFALLAPTLVFLVFDILLMVLIERASTGFRRLVPTFCSIYDLRFWRHERFWKMMGGNPVFLAGTPFRSVVWRMLGVRVGKCLYDEGMDIPEKTIVSIGDHATLNGGSIIQCHSLEDGVFKMDGTTVRDGVTVGVGAFIHYGITLEDGAEVEADSFLMKGTEVPPGGRYGGNPARQLSALKPAAAAVVAGGESG
jgi:non-ribosomal peptide synthetase-like protein